MGIAADDAAGLAIRELMRADIATINQGVRNANDAISLIQTADGALGVIDEKLIRMKELAEQAATGTYNSDQRLMIDSEFQAMAAEIQRIATATDFNGVKLLDGSLSGNHDGSGLTSTGALKVHFGAGNDSAEDYYYLNVGDATLHGLGLDAGGGFSGQFRSGVISFGFIPAGAKNVSILVDGLPGLEDDIQLFTRDGVHILGTPMTDYTWVQNAPLQMSEKNGFNPGAAYVNALPNVTNYFKPPIDATMNSFTYNGMNINYSGDFDSLMDGNDGGIMSSETAEQVLIDELTEDIVLVVSGRGIFDITATWDSAGKGAQAISIQTQQLAQEALGKLNEAIIRKDKIRANLGAMQNRLENTSSNLQIQAENLQAAESRISDVDVAEEMTEFARNQILTQAAVAMLAQANSMPQMALGLMQ